MNYGGSRKTISSAYGNVSGSRKQIYPYSATTTYTWNKYSVKTNTTSGEITATIRSGNTANFGYCIYEGQTFRYGSNSSIIAGTNTYITFPNSITITSSNYDQISDLAWCSFWTTYDEHPTPPAHCWYNNVKDYAGYNSSGIYQLYPNHTVTARAGSVSYSRGSTSYGTVTSTDRNTYPDNGKSGSYWYIFVS